MIRRNSLGVRLIRTHSRKHSIEYRLAGYDGRLLLLVKAREVVVVALREGDTWDLLYSSERVARQRTSRGIVCTLCDSGSPAFQRLEALWCAHDFEPLRLWLNRELGESPDVEFHCIDGATWVRTARRHEGKAILSNRGTLVELLSRGSGCPLEYMPAD